MTQQDRPADMVPMTREGAVAVLTLNYPAKRNAFCLQMREQLLERLTAAINDAEVRAIVLTGAAGQFCSGGDISEMRQRSIVEDRVRWDLPLALIRAIAIGPKPVVTAVEGAAAGAGLSLVSLSDHAVVASNAKFAAAFIRVGLLPDMGGLWSLQHRVGRVKAREIFGLARAFDGTEAQRIGLADAVVEPGKALEHALSVAREYAQMPPLATALIKSAFAQGIDSFDAALRTEVDMQSLVMSSQDHREAVAAFMEKRAPVFTGR